MLTIKTERDGEKIETDFLEVFIGGRKYRVQFGRPGLKITDSSYETKEMSIIPLAGNQIVIK